MQGEMIEIVGGTSEILGRLSAALGAGATAMWFGVRLVMGKYR